MNLERQYEVRRFGVRSAALGHLEGRLQEARRYRFPRPYDAGCRAVVGDTYARLTASTCVLCDLVWALVESDRHLRGARRRAA